MKKVTIKMRKEFREWRNALEPLEKAKARYLVKKIVKRSRDFSPVGGSAPGNLWEVHELGKGDVMRIYVGVDGDFNLLLLGGFKSSQSTANSDIMKATEILHDVERRRNGQ